MKLQPRMWAALAALVLMPGSHVACQAKDGVLPKDANKYDLKDGTPTKADGISTLVEVVSESKVVTATFKHSTSENASTILSISTPVDSANPGKPAVAGDFSNPVPGTTVKFDLVISDRDHDYDRALAEAAQKEKPGEDARKFINTQSFTYVNLGGEAGYQDYEYFGDDNKVASDSEYDYSAFVNVGYVFSSVQTVPFVKGILDDSTVQFGYKSSTSFKAQPEEERGILSADGKYFKSVSSAAGEPTTVKKDLFYIEYKNQFFGDRIGVNPRVTYSEEDRQYGIRTGIYFLPKDKPAPGKNEDAATGENTANEAQASGFGPTATSMNSSARKLGQPKGAREAGPLTKDYFEREIRNISEGKSNEARVDPKSAAPASGLNNGIALANQPKAGEAENGADKKDSLKELHDAMHEKNVKKDTGLLFGIIHNWLPDANENSVSVVIGGTF